MDAAALICARRLMAAAVLSLETLLLPLPAQAADAVQALPPSTLTAANDNLWDLSARWPREAGASRQQWMAAVLRRNPQAFVGGNIHRLRVGVALQWPTAADVAAEDVRAAVALIEAHRSAQDKGRPVPRLPDLVQTRPPGPDAAAVTPPVSAEAASAASRAAPEPASAPVSPSAATPAVPSASGRSSVPWLLGVLALAGVGGAHVWWRRRRAQQRFEESVLSSFFDENGERRISRPRIVDVSQAAADMARTVETLQPSAQVVRGEGASMVAALPAAALEQEAVLKLALARASLELGQVTRARALLQAVHREGPAALQQQAQTLIASLPAA